MSRLGSLCGGSGGFDGDVGDGDSNTSGGLTGFI